MIEGKVMVEAPRRIPAHREDGGDEVPYLNTELRWCSQCSLAQSHGPHPPEMFGPPEFAILGPYPEAWCTAEVLRLVRLMKVATPPVLLSAIYCAEESPTEPQRAQCQHHVHATLRMTEPALVVVVGRMAPVSLGFDPRAVLSGRVGIWHDPLDTGAGCFCLFVDAPDGHNNHKVLDQLYPLPAMLNGDMSLMRLVGAGGCAFGECNASTFVLDKTGIPWCKGHQWGGIDDGRKMKKRKGQHNRGTKGRGKK